MDLSVIIILMLIAEISMVSWIFVWAHRSLGKMRATIVELLSGDSPDGEAIMEALGKNIYNKLYRYFNLNIPKNLPASPDYSPENVPDLPPIPGIPGAAPGMAEIAKQFGVDPKMLQYLPLLQQFLRKSPNSPGGSTGSAGDRW